MKKLLIMALCLSSAIMATADTVYKKVIAPMDDYSGEYLILHENDSLDVAIIFDGSLTDLDVRYNKFEQPILEGTDGVRYVEANDKTNAATFTVTKNGDVYYIRSASGYYIGYNSTTEPIEPDLKSNATKTYDNTIAMAATGTSIVVTAKNGFELRYNADEGSERFRYHASGKKKGIKFYKKVEQEPAPALNADVNNDGVVDISDINAVISVICGK